MVLDPSGDVHRAVSISNYISEYDMYSATQGLIQIKEDYFFSGWSYGFRTRLQTLEKDEDDADYDAYVYKYVFGRDASYTSCLYEQSISLADARRQLTKMSISTISQTSVYSLVTNAARIEDRMTRHQKYFYPYTSRYSGGFNLLDTLKIPKACAYKSANLTAVEYYRGQNAL